MTKVAIFSDLHTEHSNMHIHAGKADILAFIGDICAGPSPEHAVDWIISKSQGKPSLFIPGNHEFERMVVDNAIDDMRRACEGTNVHFLYNESYDFQDIRFIGSTLWSGFNLFNNSSRETKKWLFDELKHMDPNCDPEFLRESVMKACQDLVGDFQKIWTDKDNKITPWDMTEYYHEAVRYIMKELIQCREDGKKSFVLTHFAPSPRSIAKMFENDPKSAYWANDCDHLVKMANVWAHGHTHTSFKYRVGDNPNLGNVFCNARGVTRFYDLADNPHFKNPLIVDSKDYKAVAKDDDRILMKKVSSGDRYKP